LVAAGVVSVILGRQGWPWSRSLLIGWLFFCGALLPVMGFARVGFMNYSYVSDHYQHIAIIGVCALAGVAWKVLHRKWQLPARLLGAVVVIVLAAATALQSRLYGDSEQLYARTLAANPDVPLIHNDYGNILFARGEPANALTHYDRALALGPILPEYHFNRGNALAQLGRYEEAVSEYKNSLALNPDYAMAHDRLGIAIVQVRGSESLAIEHFRQAVRLKPDFLSAMNNLAWLYATARNPGDRDGKEAVRLAERAAELTDRKDPHILDTLAAAYAQAGSHLNAVEIAQQAIDAARASDQKTLIKELEERLRRYKAMASPSRTQD
jgi:tetratricopeptide (TPR) repeat protein